MSLCEHCCLLVSRGEGAAPLQAGAHTTQALYDASIQACLAVSPAAHSLKRAVIKLHEHADVGMRQLLTTTLGLMKTWAYKRMQHSATALSTQTLSSQHLTVCVT